MKYFIPKLEPAGQFELENEPQDKLGGLPFGLPAEAYPRCGECGAPMSLLAQFLHHRERLNLGKENRVLFIFQCNSDRICKTWSAYSGANLCLIVEPENLTGRVENLPDAVITLEKEFRVASWQQLDDTVTEEESKFFLDTDKYDEISDEEAEEIFEKIVDVTKLGGVPSWIQYPEIPEGKWKFVGQLDADTGFNFGDAGIGYIFLEEVENPAQLPKGKFFWQCG